MHKVVTVWYHITFILYYTKLTKINIYKDINLNLSRVINIFNKKMRYMFIFGQRIRMIYDILV